MITVTSGDKLFSLSEVIDNIRTYLQQHDITELDERFILVLSVALNEPPDFIRGALRK
jgi:hypothetical protein